MMGYIEWKMIQTARENADGLNPWVMGLLVAALMGTTLYGILAMRRME